MTEIGEKRSFIGRYAKLLVVLATVAGATSGIFANLTAAPPLAIGFWRLTIALPFFAVPVFTKGRDTLKTLTGRDIGISLLAGLFLSFYLQPVLVKADEKGYTVAGPRPEKRRLELERLLEKEEGEKA